jgi:hypothetical protein
VPGQPRHVAREKHSAICTGFRHGKAPCSSAQLSPDRLSPTLYAAQLNACAYSPINDCLSRLLTAACRRIPDMAWPLATTDALTRHVAHRQVETPQSTTDLSTPTRIAARLPSAPALVFFSVGRAVLGRGQRARLAWMQSGCSVTKTK